MNTQTKIGIMGTGRIAAKVVENTLLKMSSLQVWAVGSRTQDKADDFAKKLGIPKAYGSYEDLVKDPDIKLIYITTPHSEHLKNIKLCAENGKNIICEKSLCLNEKEAKEAFTVAKKNNVLLAEAIWPRYAPMARLINEFLASNKLGTITGITANLGYDVWEKDRVRSLELGGGALLDVGIYCLNFIDLVQNLDSVNKIEVSGQLDATGVDRYESVLLGYDNGCTATFYSSIINTTDRYGVIYGTKGHAVIENVNNYASLSFYDNSRNTEPILLIKAPEMITGYEYQFESCCKAIEQGQTSVQYATEEQSLRLMRTMDRIRAKLGVVFSTDK